MKDTQTPETDAQAWDAENYTSSVLFSSIVVDAAFARRLERERDEARKLAIAMHAFDPQQRPLPWREPKTPKDKLAIATKTLQDIDQYGSAMRGEWASEKAAEALKQIQ